VNEIQKLLEHLITVVAAHELQVDEIQKRWDSVNRELTRAKHRHHFMALALKGVQDMLDAHSGTLDAIPF
jgi:hypothetical protein